MKIFSIRLALVIGSVSRDIDELDGWADEVIQGSHSLEATLKILPGECIITRI